MGSYFLCMSNIFNLKGRTTRWNFFIALVVVTVVTAILGFLSKAPIIGFVMGIIAWIYGIISFVACFTMTCRRLNDAGFSKWFSLLWFVPGIGEIALFILCCFPSK